jgi:hypothetical protein
VLGKADVLDFTVSIGLAAGEPSVAYSEVAVRGDDALQ